MAIKLARKYTLIFPKEKSIRYLIFKTLQDNGNIEFEKMTEKEIKKDLKEQVSQLDYLISSFKFAISYLALYGSGPSFFQKLSCPRILVKREKKERFEKDSSLENIVERIAEIEKEKEKMTSEKKEIEKRLSEFEKLESLDFIPVSTKHTASTLISLPQGLISKFEELARKYNIWYKEIKRISGKIILVSIFLEDEKKEFLEELKGIKAEALNYEFHDIPEKIIRDLKEKRSELERFESSLERELANYGKALKKLKVYHDLLLIERVKINIEEKSLRSTFIDYLTFYSLRENKAHLEGKLKKLSPELSIIEVKEKKENLPVVLENNEILKPLQYVTEIFGLPQATEVDPTPFLAIFFLVFFGVSLTDAGYGLVLCLFTLLPLLFLKKVFPDTRLLRLLFYGGIFTMIMGVLFGGYFGVAAEQITFLPFLGKMKKIDPIKDTVLFMGLTFFLGYLQIFFSQIVKIISGLKNKNRGLIESGFSWALFYIFGGISLAGIKIGILRNVGIFGLVISGLFVIFCGGKEVKNIFLKPLVGLVKFLQGLIGTISDVLSYSRLMALGLATGVIGLIINQIAMMLKDLIPVFGWVVGGLVLIGGHTFNLGINALSGFIHSGRLQFVEFFPKFLEGGGRRFKPLKADLKYIEFK